jgi:hypothetical protein
LFRSLFVCAGAKVNAAAIEKGDEETLEESLGKIMDGVSSPHELPPGSLAYAGDVVEVSVETEDVAALEVDAPPIIQACLNSDAAVGEVSVEMEDIDALEVDAPAVMPACLNCEEAAALRSRLATAVRDQTMRGARVARLASAGTSTNWRLRQGAKALADTHARHGVSLDWFEREKEYAKSVVVNRFGTMTREANEQRVLAWCDLRLAERELLAGQAVLVDVDEQPLVRAELKLVDVELEAKGVMLMRADISRRIAKRADATHALDAVQDVITEQEKIVKELEVEASELQCMVEKARLYLAESGALVEFLQASVRSDDIARADRIAKNRAVALVRRTAMQASRDD